MGHSGGRAHALQRQVECVQEEGNCFFLHGMANPAPPPLSCASLYSKMRTVLYGKKAANLYTQAFVQNTQARALYQESEDTYYRANDAASYDDWRRARHQWDYFYNRYVLAVACAPHYTAPHQMDIYGFLLHEMIVSCRRKFRTEKSA